MKTRILTAVVLAPIVLGALFLSSPWPLTILAAVMGYVGGREVSRMLGHDSPVAGVLAGLLVALSPLAAHGPLALPSTAALAMLGVVAAWTCARKPAPLLIPFSLLWVAAPLASILYLSPPGPENQIFRWELPALLAILPLWGGDTAAIFAGKAFGKHLLAPAISPKKTVEGAIANLLACVLVAWGLGMLINMPTLPSVLCGLAAGTFGQAGDLFESYVKRKAGLKDSGTLLPGHGGLMDRIDSILFTAPVVALIVWIFR